MDVEVGGLRAWVDMGEGVEVGKVCGPKVMPLDPLPVREVEQFFPPPGCVPAEVGSGNPPPCSNFYRDTPIWGMVCVGCGPNFARGYPLGRKLCGWRGIIGESRRLGV